MTENKRKADPLRVIVTILLGLLLSAYAYFGLEAKADIRRLDETKVEKDSFSMLCDKVNSIDKKTDDIYKLLSDRK